MPNARSKPRDPSSAAAPRLSGPPDTEPKPVKALFEAACSGDWMPANELKAAALRAVEAGNDVTISLSNIQYLDASALQVLLALDAEQKRRGRNLELVNTSSQLRRWFDYAGVANHFQIANRMLSE